MDRRQKLERAASRLMWWLWQPPKYLGIVIWYVGLALCFAGELLSLLSDANAALYDEDAGET
ncbi:MAG: hypothetical protein IH945_02105 [Armatimonadetes bacterium]|nr:hypothetical protein [Armatimonadota bacterium]